MGSKGTKSEYKKVAEERILYLFAQLNNTKDPLFSKNCARLIRAICLRYNIRLKKEQKEIFCKNCFSVFRLEPPKIRIKSIKKNGKDLVQKKIICSYCGNSTILNYKKN